MFTIANALPGLAPYFRPALRSVSFSDKMKQVQLRRFLSLSNATSPKKINITPVPLHQSIARFSNAAFGNSVCQFESRNSDKNLFALGGYKNVLNSLGDFVRYLQNPESFTESGVQHMKGVILSGPPGVGKTFVAEAIAGHAGVPFFLVSGSQMLDRFVGGTEENLRTLFAKAKKAAPCVICIDELEAIAPKRILSSDNQTNAYYINATIGQLLSLLSQDHPGVIVIGTTNHFQLLDPAIIREGRFDRHIYFPLPTKEERKEILELHTKDKNLGSGASLKDLAAISGGYSGAKLAGWVNEAALSAMREKSRTIEINHFDAAKTLIDVGVMLPENTLDPAQKFYLAVHESGHALIGHYLGEAIYKVSIIAHGVSNGHTQFLPSEKENFNKNELLDQICICLGGRAAELLELNIPVEGCKDDIANARAIAFDMIHGEAMGSLICGSMNDVEEILQSQLKRAKDLLEQNKETWKKVIDALVKHSELFQKDFKDVLAGKKLKPKRIVSQNIDASSLPQTTIRREKIEEKPEVESIEPLPFSLEEVAKALKIPPDKIRKISRHYFGKGFEIIFKPSITGKKVANISNVLTKNDIENSHDRYDNGITIQSLGAEDFVKLVKNS